MASSKRYSGGKPQRGPQGKGPGAHKHAQPRAHHGHISNPESVIAAVTAVVQPSVDEAGLFLESVKLGREGARTSVRITLDLDENEVGSLGSERLQNAARAISAALDVDDVVPGEYILEVSTPGTSRPLTEARHFKRARTRLVSLVLADGGTVTGRLSDVVHEGDDATLVLDVDGAERGVLLADVKRGRVEVEMNRIDDVELDEDFEDGADVGEDSDDDDGDGADDADESDSDVDQNDN